MKKEKISRAGSRIATVCAYVGFSALFSLSGIAVAMHWDSETLTLATFATGAVSVWGLWRSFPLRRLGRAFFAPINKSRTRQFKKRRNKNVGILRLGR
jgi:hypothetical protein